MEERTEREGTARGGTDLAKGSRSTPGQCSKCGNCYSPYMVKDHVWLLAWPSYEQEKKANPKIHIELCFDCLREAIQRPLRIDDFVNKPINSGIRLGFKMGLTVMMQSIANNYK